MSVLYSYRYDPKAAALYIRVVDQDQARDIARQREYSENIVLDLTVRGTLVGIEVLDLSADLTQVVREYDLNPELLATVDAIRKVAPHAHKELSLV